MLCPPPITTVTVGFEREAIISAIARPASTSPPTVLRIIMSPSIRGFCSAATSWGIKCSYFVVLFCGGSTKCPSICPIMVRQKTLDSPGVGIVVCPNCWIASEAPSGFFSVSGSLGAGSASALTVLHRNFMSLSISIITILPGLPGPVLA
ncbi:hypothetical protein D3C76_1358630 [compost metagenome]